MEFVTRSTDSAMLASSSSSACNGDGDADAAETVTEQVVDFNAVGDDFPLRGVLFAPAGATAAPLVLVSAAMGMRASFYAPYARFLAANGCTVLCYDYRGMGLSMHPNGITKLSDAGVHPHWAMRDQPAALRELRLRATPAKDGAPRATVIVGHSIGGYLAPLLDARAEPVDRVLLVAVGSAFERYLRYSRLAIAVFGHVFPLASRALGYFPGAMAGLGDNIPSRAGQQWAQFSTRRHFMMEADAAQPHGNQTPTPLFDAYASARTPVLSLSFEDDELLSAPAFADFLSFLPACQRVWFHLVPSLVGTTKPVGHHGFFKERIGGQSARGGGFARSLWAESLGWILHGRCDLFAGREPAAAAEPGEGGYAWADTAAAAAAASVVPKI